MKVSIIVPLYNAEKFAHRCIDSILAQSYDDYELLLVDDGSKDGTSALCDDYAQEHRCIKVFHKENGGVSSARNLGLNHATGEWVTFVDADDWVEPNFLQSVQNADDKKVDWVFAEWRTLWDDGRPNELNRTDKGHIISGRDEVKRIWNEMAGDDICRCPWGKFFRRAIIEDNNLRFDESLRYGEDTVFNYQYFSLVHSLQLSNMPDADYIFHQTAGTRAVQKYRCTPEGITTVRDKIFNIFFAEGMSNLKFERLIFFSFTMLEHCYLGKSDGKVRRDYYRSPIQKELERRCLSSIKFYDQMMYWSFKYLPHRLIYPIAKQYLNFR